jgi:predicted branched-subunit amino acid permease
LDKSTGENNNFKTGLLSGIPIALGYIPVSFTFGLVAAKAGIPPLTAIIISLTNLTSAGQFAGVGLISAGAALYVIAFTTFVINIRYMLMSLSISQKITRDMSFFKRAVMAFGITDEVFAVASMEKGKIGFSFMAGLISLPYLGWAAGTFLGAFTNSILPESLQSAMGVALYGMFIALVVPTAKKSRPVLMVALVAVALSCAFKWVHIFRALSSGWSIIIAAVAASLAGALIFPRKEEEV